MLLTGLPRLDLCSEITYSTDRITEVDRVFRLQAQSMRSCHLIGPEEVVGYDPHLLPKPVQVLYLGLSDSVPQRCILNSQLANVLTNMLYYITRLLRGFGQQFRPTTSISTQRRMR